MTEDGGFRQRGTRWRATAQEEEGAGTGRERWLRVKRRGVAAKDGGFGWRGTNEGGGGRRTAALATCRLSAVRQSAGQRSGMGRGALDLLACHGESMETVGEGILP